MFDEVSWVSCAWVMMMKGKEDRKTLTQLRDDFLGDSAEFEDRKTTKIVDHERKRPLFNTAQVSTILVISIHQLLQHSLDQASKFRHRLHFFASRLIVDAHTQLQLIVRKQPLFILGPAGNMHMVERSSHGDEILADFRSKLCDFLQ